MFTSLQALEAIESLQKNIDTLIVIPNNYLLDIGNEHLLLRMLSFLLMMFYIKDSKEFQT
jgi:hypothetical protein